MQKVLKKRKMQQEQMIELARSYATSLNQQIGPLSAILTGSVARGDFNLHSDIDVLIISEKLPSNPLERSKFLYSIAPPGLEPKGFTPQEFEDYKAKKNPLVLDAISYGIPLI
jgi:hypothetical protein